MLGAAQFSNLAALQPLGQVESAAIQRLRSLTASVAGRIQDTFKAIETERLALLGGVQEQFRRELDFRHHLVDDTLTRIAREATAGLRSMTLLWDDQISRVTRAVIDSYRLLHVAPKDIVSDGLRRLTEGIQEAQLAAFPSVAAMADQIADALRVVY